jgi:hypothetical protein
LRAIWAKQTHEYIAHIRAAVGLAHACSIDVGWMAWAHGVAEALDLLVNFAEISPVEDPRAIIPAQ